MGYRHSNPMDLTTEADALLELTIHLGSEVAWYLSDPLGISVYGKEWGDAKRDHIEHRKTELMSSAVELLARCEEAVRIHRGAFENGEYAIARHPEWNEFFARGIQAANVEYSERALRTSQEAIDHLQCIPKLTSA